MCHEEEQGVQNPINSQAVFHRALNSQEMQIGLIWKSLGNAGLKETSLAGFFFFFFFLVRQIFSMLMQAGSARGR